MNPECKISPTDIFFGKGNKEENIFYSNEFERVVFSMDEYCSKLVDIHRKQKVEIHYLRIASEEEATVCFSSKATVLKVFNGNEFGSLLAVKYQKRQYTVWLPSAYGRFCFDQSHRISIREKFFLPFHWKINADIQLYVVLSGIPGERAIVPYMIIEDACEEFIEEIRSLNRIERNLYRKSDWFFANYPSDIWTYLINGSLYDPRGSGKIRKRFKCQQCAWAWWSYFGFLNKETGKKLYDILQNIIAYSVLLDMSPKGEWGHGFCSNEIETHARFHLDGIHLLISQHEKTREPVWLKSAERGMAYVAEHLMEQLDDGSLWFLHDTTEYKDERTHFQSTLFGKSPGNSLCINTHVQALTVLYRLKHVIPQNTVYAERLEKGLHALQRVLEHQPAEALYRIFIFIWMKWRRWPTSRVEKVIQAVKIISLRKVFWAVRRQFPRLVYPGGWIDRDLTIGCFSEHYQITNLKDLLTLYQQIPLPWLVPYIKNNFLSLQNFLFHFGLPNALAFSSYYIEFMDVLYMYDISIEKLDEAEIQKAKETIYRQTGGYSVDYYASELVRPK